MTNPDTELSGFHDLVGVEVEAWRDGFAQVGLTLAPRHLNRNGIVHGGVLLAMLDEVGALSGLWCSIPANRRSSVTVDLAAHFTGQSRDGRVVGTGELVSHGRSLYFTRTEIRDATGRMLAYGTSTHKWRRGSETTEGSPA